MTEIHFPEVPLPEVSNEPRIIVPLGHLNRVVLVKLSQLLHQFERHVLITNVQNETWPALVDLLG